MNHDAHDAHAHEILTCMFPDPRNGGILNIYAMPSMQRRAYLANPVVGGSTGPMDPLGRAGAGAEGHISLATSGGKDSSGRRTA